MFIIIINIYYILNNVKYIRSNYRNKYPAYMKYCTISEKRRRDKYIMRTKKDPNATTLTFRGNIFSIE